MIHQGIKQDIKKPKVGRGQKYKGKSIASQLTYHHLKAKRYGGKATLDNGAVICRSCHDWLEQLSEMEREIINDELREYKRKIDMAQVPEISITVAQITTNGIEKSKLIQFDESNDIEVIPAYDTTPEDREKYQKYLTERRKRELSKNKWKNSLKVETNPVNVQKILTGQQKKEQQEIFEDNLREMRY